MANFHSKWLRTKYSSVLDLIAETKTKSPIKILKIALFLILENAFMKNIISLVFLFCIIYQNSFAGCDDMFPTYNAPTSIAPLQNVYLPDGQKFIFIFRGQMYNTYDECLTAQKNLLNNKLWVKNTDVNDWISGKIGTLEDAKIEVSKYCRISRDDKNSSSGSLGFSANDNLYLTSNPVISKMFIKNPTGSYFEIHFVNSVGQKFRLGCVACGTYADLFANIKGILSIGCPELEH